MNEKQLKIINVTLKESKTGELFEIQSKSKRTNCKTIKKRKE
jgi:hypothetical protein